MNSKKLFIEFISTQEIKQIIPLSKKIDAFIINYFKIIYDESLAVEVYFPNNALWDSYLEVTYNNEQSMFFLYGEDSKVVKEIIINNKDVVQPILIEFIKNTK